MISLVSSRYSVYSGNKQIGVVVPRNDGWSFVPFAQPSNAAFLFYFGETPEAAILAAGYSVCVVKEAM